MYEVNQHKHKRVYKVVLILLMAMAVISGARRDLKQLLSLANDVQALHDQWLGAVMPTAHARTTLMKVEGCPLNNVVQAAAGSDEFRWSGRVDQGKSIEIKGLS